MSSAPWDPQHLLKQLTGLLPCVISIREGCQNVLLLLTENYERVCGANIGPLALVYICCVHQRKIMCLMHMNYVLKIPRGQRLL